MVVRYKDEEAEEIIKDLPIVTPFPSQEDKANGITDGFKQKPNAFVALSKDGKRLEVFPSTGGWLGFDPTTADGDLAPFSD